MRSIIQAAVSFSTFLFITLPNPVLASEQARFDAQTTEQQIVSALSTFYTPGMAVGVVHKNDIVFLNGFGQSFINAEHVNKVPLLPNAQLLKNQSVRPGTYFRLASTSKAFTAAALAVLVDQKKLNWKDKVIDHLPEFQMQDPWVSREFTIEDLLTHRSGLVSGAGDSMIWPEPSGFSRQEVIHRLKHLTPDYSFRSAYSYSNVLYITVGELIARVSGESYASFLQKHIFAPLNMSCYAGDVPKSALAKTALPYAHNDARGLYLIPRNAIGPKAQMSVAAGGIVCNAESMTKWIQALLAPSTLPFSEAQLQAMWTPRTIMRVSNTEQEWDGTHFKSYGYGWRMSNLQHYKVLSHTGTLSGFQAFVSLIPELELGVVILNNGSNYGARSSVMQHILKSFLPTQDSTHSEVNDWVQTYSDYQAEQESQYLANKLPDPTPTKPMLINDSDVLGIYQDAWFGQMIIEAIDGKLRISSQRMSTLKGTLSPFEGNKYKVTWDNQNAASNAFLLFELNLANEVSGMKMHPFTSRERKRHAYRDMHFVKQ
ncbi:serine hydrolase [Glaciecola sp. MH2013]|uniref:serine hydrolase n=1 Tax=Glaciecola sp. MH2013 TaxID=2785524 RepID=UPI00189F9501|nr:serine hydrolase [Glaciecola sp. MH2013]MBF7072125.1 serine hydrolase [Glaciecola sp. MH2013]